MRRIFLILTAVAVLTMAFPVPESHAFVDPVTIMILAPVALKAAAIAKPYVIKGLANLGKHFLLMGYSMLEAARFPVGLFQMTIGAPMGGFSSGLKNVVKGGLGFGKFLVRTMMIPTAIFGLSF